MGPCQSKRPKIAPNKTLANVLFWAKADSVGAAAGTATVAGGEVIKEKFENR